MDMEAHSILEPSLCFPLIFDGGASKKLWPLSTNGGIKKKKKKHYSSFDFKKGTVNI